MGLEMELQSLVKPIILPKPEPKGLGFRQWIIWYAIILHWLWGAALLSSTAPLGVTAINSIVRLGIVSSTMAGYYYLLIACLALVGMGAPRKVGIWFVLPQSLTLILSSWGALVAMVTGKFADGVPRPASFLIADQAPAIIAAILHTVAVINNYFLVKE